MTAHISDTSNTRPADATSSNDGYGQVEEEERQRLLAFAQLVAQLPGNDEFAGAVFESRTMCASRRDTSALLVGRHHRAHSVERAAVMWPTNGTADGGASKRQTQQRGCRRHPEDSRQPIRLGLPHRHCVLSYARALQSRCRRWRDNGRPPAAGGRF